MNGKSYKVAVILLWLVSLSSMFYLLMLGWYNVLSADDYGYVFLMEDRGFFASIKETYLNWQCRFSTFFMNNFIYLLFGRSANLIGVTVIMLLIGYLSVGLLFNGIINKYNLFLPKSVMIASTVLLVNIGVMSYIEPNTFFWLCALNYTFSSWMTILLVYSIFFCKSHKIIRWILLVFTSLYISGTAENFTPMVILVLGITWLYRIIRAKTIRCRKDEINNYLFVSLVIMSIGFVILLLGPGNKARIESNGDDADLIGRLSLSFFFIKTIKSSLILLLRFLSRSLYYLALLPVFAFVGMIGKTTGPISKVKAKHLICVLNLLFIFILVEDAVCVFGTGWYAPPRALSFMSFVIIIPLCILAFLVGVNMSEKNKKSIVYVMMISSVITLGVILKFYVEDEPVAKLYHTEITYRNQMIEKEVEKGRIDDLVVEPIHEKWKINTYSMVRNAVNTVCGKSKRYLEYNTIYNLSILSSDSNNWRNEGLKKYYHAKFDIIGWYDE